MKSLSLLLALLLLLQSCNVYHSPTTLETAVAAKEKVMVVTEDNQKYRFKWLEKNDDRLTGVTKSGSPTAKKLVGTPGSFDGTNVAFDLSGLDIEQVRLRNKSSSTSLTAITIVGTLLAGALAIFYISFASSRWEFGKG